jgi:hypothetical protein
MSDQPLCCLRVCTDLGAVGAPGSAGGLSVYGHGPQPAAGRRPGLLGGAPGAGSCGRWPTVARRRTGLRAGADQGGPRPPVGVGWGALELFVPSFG